MKGNEKAILCLTTVANSEAAAALSERLVIEGLAACVNEIAVASTFRWKGKLERQNERLLLIKTTAKVWPRLRDRIGQLSTYEVPEVLAVEASAIESTYHEWLVSSMTGDR